MLCITRRAQETVLIAGTICVTVEAVLAHSVRLRVSEPGLRDRFVPLAVGEHLALLDDQVTVELTGIHCRAARIGICAPPHVSVYRGELADRLLLEGHDITQPLRALPALPPT